MKRDLYFEAMVNPEILERLTRQFGPFARHHADITVSSEVLQNMVGKYQTKSHRRAEVVMVIPNEAGDIWLHTKAFYPNNIYRLMTGGINAKESPEAALKREVLEETGFKVDIQRCVAVITYQFLMADTRLDFGSYLFLTTPGQGYPQPNDPGEAIADFRAVPAAQLLDVAEQLRLLQGKFADWGVFRAVSHSMAAIAWPDIG